MIAKSYEIDGPRLLELDGAGTRLISARDAIQLISAAAERPASLLVIPKTLRSEEFFDLRTGIAGQIIQKFAAYGLRACTVGDISRPVDASSALRDFGFESNRGNQVWFLEEIKSGS